MARPLHPPPRSLSFAAPHPFSRRELLQVGYSSLLSLSLPNLLAAQARGETEDRASLAGVPRARRVLFIFLTGGPSHIDTFDLKPDAPAEIRGEFAPIATNVPGISVCEHLPKLARHFDKLAVIRTMHCAPSLASHETGTHAMLTGHNALPPGAGLYASRNDWPCFAAGVDRLRPGEPGLPTGVNLPHMSFNGNVYCGQNAGFLGPRHDPWRVDRDPNDPQYQGDASLTFPAGLGLEHLGQRRALLAAIDRQQASLESAAAVQSFSTHQSTACRVLASGRLARAFSLADEPASTRDRYGRHRFGQSLLLARRVLEAGVPIVQANMGSAGQWDTHTNNCSGLRDYLLPPLDTAVSALLDDLQSSGLLQETLVVLTGEFGRTPKLGGNVGTAMFSPEGRDHWTACFTSVLAGCGVQGGRTIGRSDRIAAYPMTTAYTPADLGATVYSALGIHPRAEIEDHFGRPLVLNDGHAIVRAFDGREG